MVGEADQAQLDRCRLRAGKGRRRFTQVTANSAGETAAAAAGDSDMIIGNSRNVEAVPADAMGGSFPAAEETADIEVRELERFLERPGS